MEEGVHDISIEQYHSGPGISRSGLMDISKSPLHYWHNSINPNKIEKEPPPVITKMDALGFGNALHTFVLENDEFMNRYIILPKVSRATKAGKEAFANAKQEADSLNKEILCQEAFTVIQSMSDSIQAHPDAPGLISEALYEQSIFWKDIDTGLLCKVRPDIWHQNMIVDLKTCQSASERDFQRSVYSFGYHVQAGMIKEALARQLAINMENFLFVAVEKEPPYAVAVYQLDELAVEQGVYDFKQLLLTLKHHLDTDRWPSYQTGRITLPNYALRGYAE